jgi:hypothetical protein
VNNNILKDFQGATDDETIISNTTYCPLSVKCHPQPIFMRMLVKMGIFTEQLTNIQAFEGSELSIYT